MTNDNGKWTIKTNDVRHNSDVPVEQNVVQLVVLKMEFLSETDTKFSLFVNPDLETSNEEPAVADLEVTDNLSFQFDHLDIMLGNAADQADLDEIRFGTSFASVTPPCTTCKNDLASVGKGGSNISLAPNPLTAEGETTIHLEGQSNVAIHDLDGNPVFVRTDAQDGVKVSRNAFGAPGIYVVSVEKNGNIQSKLLMVK